jgi:iron(III) transport system ATP-binding protein
VYVSAAMTDKRAQELNERLPQGRAGPVFAGQVSFEDVGYQTHTKSIVSGIDLKVEAGRIACLLGPSGCGKTTLLRLAAGIINPTKGRILLDSYEVAGPHRFVPPERRNVGMVFQDFALFPHMTARENVAYGLYALERSEALRVAALALERVGLGHAMDRRPNSLSGGEQQRVALARALVPRPQVILLDEPFSGLDQRLKDSVRDETLALLRETRATAILVTHDPDEALAIADQIHVMQTGAIAQSGAPHIVLHNPVSRAVARFFRNYNCLTGVVQNSSVDTVMGQVAAANYADNTAVDVLISPDSVDVVAVGRGIAATIVENRDVGSTRRMVLRLHSNDQKLLINGTHAGLGPVGLVLTGKDTHIFESADENAR